MSAEELYSAKRGAAEEMTRHRRRAAGLEAVSLVRQPGWVRFESAIYLAIAHHAGLAGWMHAPARHHGYRWCWLRSAPCRPDWAGDQEWWMVPSNIERRVQLLIAAASRQQQRRTDGWCDDSGVQKIMKTWLSNDHWRRVITRE